MRIISREIEKIWYFCDKHIHPRGNFKGVYVLNKPLERVDWKATKAVRNVKTTGTSTTALAANKTANKTGDKLTVVSRLKEVMCSCLMLSDNDTDKLCTKITGQGN